MRKKIVAGNWKMNTTVEEGLQLVSELESKIKDLKINAEIVVAPPFTHLFAVSQKLDKQSDIIKLSAQNCAEEISGAYTGEVSVSMLHSLSCKYVIVGHSERREYFGESNSQLLKKVKLALASDLCPIYCVGEKLCERESGDHFNVVSSQIEQVLCMLEEGEAANVVVAYEPVWAIGTGKTATADQAEEMHKHIREVIGKKFPAISDNISILYGGSCKPSNAAEIFAKENVDGGLIGGASLSADDFTAIINAI